MVKFAVLFAAAAAAFENVGDRHAQLHRHGQILRRQTDENAAKEVMSELQANYTAATRAAVQGNGQGECTWEKMIVRKEWSALTPDERKRYLQALQCLQNSPNKTPSNIAPGARNRNDDFAAAHVFNMEKVHFSPWLLPWHRQFTYNFEKVLRDECGWDQGQPYWDWSLTATQPMAENALFDGSATSLSGNGHVVQTAADGGECSCVTSGPLSNWTVNLGPKYTTASCKDNPQADGLGYNPRCLEREFAEQYMENITYSHVVDFVMNFGPDRPTEVKRDFFTQLESWPNGPHPIPHTVIGGLQNDIPASPSDPWFFFHHSQLDRIWAIWQTRDEQNRRTAMANPDDYSAERQRRGWGESVVVKMDSVIAFGNGTEWDGVFGQAKVGDVMSPTEGAYCYRYE